MAAPALTYGPVTTGIFRQGMNMIPVGTIRIR